MECTTDLLGQARRTQRIATLSLRGGLTIDTSWQGRKG